MSIAGPQLRGGHTARRLGARCCTALTVSERCCELQEIAGSHVGGSSQMTPATKSSVTTPPFHSRHLHGNATCVESATAFREYAPWSAWQFGLPPLPRQAMLPARERPGLRAVYPRATAQRRNGSIAVFGEPSSSRQVATIDRKIASPSKHRRALEFHGWATRVLDRREGVHPRAMIE